MVKKKNKKKSSFRGRVNAVAKRQKTAGSVYGYLKLPKGISVYKPTPGSREKIDIIPYTVTDKKHPDLNEGFPTVDDLWYKRPFRIHTQVGVDNERVVCLSSFGKKCPICEYHKQQAKEGMDKDDLKAFKSKQRNLYIAIPRGIKKTEEELHIFDFSQHLFQNLLNEELAEDEDNEVFPDIEEGLTLKIRWNEESYGGHKYAEASRIDFEEREESLGDELLENVPNLDEILQELSYDGMSAKFFEMEEEESEEESEAETTSKRKKKTTKKKEDGKSPFKLDLKDLQDMDFAELVEVVEDNNINIDTEDYDENEERLLISICEEMDIKIPKKKEKKTSKKELDKKAKKEVNKKQSKNKCPFKHQFGVDTDKFDECDECDAWSDCDDEKEGN